MCTRRRNIFPRPIPLTVWCDPPYVYPVKDAPIAEGVGKGEGERDDEGVRDKEGEGRWRSGWEETLGSEVVEFAWIAAGRYVSMPACLPLA